MANTKKYISLDKLGLYDEKIKKVISDGDAATLDAAKSYANGLASNYDAAGSAATVQGKLDEEVARAKAAEEANAAAAKKAQDEVDALELVVDTKANASDLDALETYVGTIPEGSTATDIVGYVQEKTAGIATEGAMTELGNRVGVVEGKVATIEGDYLKAADKTELEGKITAAQGAADAAQGAVDALSGTHATDKKNLEDAIALKADITAMNEVAAVANAAVKQADYDVKVKALEDEDARIVGLVEAEAALARAEEGKLDARLAEVETFFETAEGETLDKALDTLVELQTYLTGEGAAADQMVKDIAANKKSIEDHVATDHDFAAADVTLKSEIMTEVNKKADKTTVEGIDGRVGVNEGKISALEGRMDSAESAIGGLEAAVATKAEAQALTNAVAALEGADAGQVKRIAALEEKFNGEEGSVADMVADAKQEAIDTAAGDATSKANAAEAAAKGHADSLNTAMNTRVEALEAIDHEHANKDLLDTYTQTEANLADAVAKKHEHSNLSVLETLTAAKVAAWDAAEQAAKTYADGLNTAMNSRVEALETWHNNFIEASEEEINNLFA